MYRLRRAADRFGSPCAVSIPSRGVSVRESILHEEAAAFAAASEAAITGDLAVCAASCGPGPRCQ
jgi:hypothetical protein